MEFNLEATNSAALPKDLYVSVRVGDVQKFAKASTTKAYKFPKPPADDKRGARIELYRRVGVCGLLGLDSGKDGSYDLNVAVDDARIPEGQVGYRLHLSGTGAKADSADRDAELDAKVKDAKEYLERHQLEQRLHQAMQAVLRERPEDPVAFLTKQLSSEVGVLKKVVEASAPPPAAPTRKPSPFPPATVVVSRGMVMFASMGRPGGFMML